MYDKYTNHHSTLHAYNWPPTDHYIYKNLNWVVKLLSDVCGYDMLTGGNVLYYRTSFLLTMINMKFGLFVDLCLIYPASLSQIDGLVPSDVFQRFVVRSYDHSCLSLFPTHLETKHVSNMIILSRLWHWHIIPNVDWCLILTVNKLCLNVDANCLCHTKIQ